MSRMSDGEREFVSDFSELSPSTQPPAASSSGFGPLAGSTSTASAEKGAGFAQRVPGGQELDARGISAPLPLLRAHRALRSMQVGEELRVYTSYPDSLAEFQAMAKYLTGYELVTQEIAGADCVHVVRRRR